MTVGYRYTRSWHYFTGSRLLLTTALIKITKLNKIIWLNRAHESNADSMSKTIICFYYLDVAQQVNKQLES